MLGFVGDALSSATSLVGDMLEDAVAFVTDVIEDVINTVLDWIQKGLRWLVDLLCALGVRAICAAAAVVAGILEGFIEGLRAIFHNLMNMTRAFGELLGAALRLDIWGVFKALLRVFVILPADFALDAFRLLTFGYVVGGIVKYYKRNALRRFVEELVDTTFGSDPKQLALVRRRIGLENGTFGFRMPSEHRVFVMDSETVPLWRMHNDGDIDLYALAGLLSLDSASAFRSVHPNTVVKSVKADGSDSLLPVNRWIISRYISSEGKDKRLRVYAMSRSIIAQKLRTASRSFREVGVILEWNDGEQFSWFRDYTKLEITEDEYDFDVAGLQTLLGSQECNRVPQENCQLLALGAFELHRNKARSLGQTAGRDIVEGNEFPPDCDTAGRTDRCCNTVMSGDEIRSGVVYKDLYPREPFQWVLAHEIGHYLGLCHYGHDGIQNIMFSGAVNDPIDAGLLNYYWDAEPHFTLEDGRNLWRFVVDQLRRCLI